MEYDIIDILTVIIILILVSAIIIINVTNVINKKLTGISVNIPPINIPDPNITVKIQKHCDKNNNEDDYKIYVERNMPSMYDISPVIEKNIEKFESVGSGSDSEKENIKTLLNDEKFLENVANYIKKKNEKIYESGLDPDFNLDKSSFNDEEIKLKPIVTPESVDRITYGYNLNDYNSFGNIYDVGKINLKDTNYKNPKPNGFIF